MNDNPTYDQIIVVGGGPAGLMAAGQAASSGAKTILLEKKPKPGRKLSITGKGRCNLTNIAPLREFIAHFGRNGKFLHQAFNGFFSHDLQMFLSDLGVDIKVERGGRVFPEGDNAPAVTEAMVNWALAQGVTIRTNSRVGELNFQNGAVTGVKCDDGTFYHGLVIITTGGASYPSTGSTGDGYRLAKSVGHTVTPIFPSLVPLEIAERFAPRLAGLSLTNVKARVFIDGKKKLEQFGEMQFTDYGLSGPIILTLSREIVVALREKSLVEVSIDLKPALDESKLDARLLRELKSRDNIQFGSVLKSLLPRKLIPVCADLVRIRVDKFSNQITSVERKRLLHWLKDFRVTVTGHRSFDEAIVTAGGVALSEVDPRTMASKLVPGLYLAGELLDVDGDTGGYNLQAAFSTGWMAGRAAAEYLLSQTSQ